MNSLTILDKNNEFEDCVDLSTFENICKNIRKYQDKIKNLEDKNKKLEDKNKELEDKNKELEDKNKELEDKNKYFQDFSEYTKLYNSLQIEKNLSQELLIKNTELEDKNKEYTKVYNSLQIEKKLSQDLLSKNKKLEDKNTKLEDKNTKLEDKNKELEAKIIELENKNTELDERCFDIECKNEELEEATNSYRDYILELEETYIENEYKDNYFKKIGENNGNIHRCNLCNTFSPLCLNTKDMENFYYIEIKYNLKNNIYYINKIIKNICCICHCYGHKYGLEEYIKKNNNTKKIDMKIIRELCSFGYRDNEYYKDNIYLPLDLKNPEDYSYIIKHLGWNFLIDIEKKWKNYNLEV